MMFAPAPSIVVARAAPRRDTESVKLSGISSAHQPSLLPRSCCDRERYGVAIAATAAAAAALVAVGSAKLRDCHGPSVVRTRRRRFVAMAGLKGRGKPPVRSKRHEWRTEEDLQDLIQELELPPAPRRLPEVRGMPPVGAPGGPSQEVIEAVIDEMVPSPKAQGSKRGQYDPHADDPFTKGIDVMVSKKNGIESLICCRGCGIPLQTHDPSNVGYVRFARYVQRWAEKLHRKILCTRCLELQRGELRPVVKETMGPKTVGFGEAVVPAEVLARQLRMIRERKCLVVYVLDLLDFNGSFIRNLREIVGRNPTLVIGTKLDLLPRRTDEEEVRKWLRYALRKKRLRVLDVKLVSSVTGRGIGQATNALLEARRGLDVFVMGAANAGKSLFITRLLDQLEERFPRGKVEEVDRPLVSRTPGTTLGTMPLRAFRRSATSPVFACLYDTPGVHQPTSLQNLIPIEVYDRVQPARPFAVQVRTPSKDALQALRESGAAVTAESAQKWLRRPVRYLWGPQGEPPVVGIEVVPPLPPSLDLAFVGVDGLELETEFPRLPGEANVASAEDGESTAVATQAAAAPEPPEGLVLAQICYVKPPEQLSLEGEVVADVALAGFGWVAVSMKAISAAAAGRPVEMPTLRLRVFGPARLKVKIGAIPMPVFGLPGQVQVPELEEDLEEEFEDQEDTQEDSAFDESQLAAPEEEWRAAGEHPLARAFARRDEERTSEGLESETQTGQVPPPQAPRADTTLRQRPVAAPEPDGDSTGLYDQGFPRDTETWSPSDSIGSMPWEDEEEDALPDDGFDEDFSPSSDSMRLRPFARRAAQAQVGSGGESTRRSPSSSSSASSGKHGGSGLGGWLDEGEYAERKGSGVFIGGSPDVPDQFETSSSPSSPHRRVGEAVTTSGAKASRRGDGVAVAELKIPDGDAGSRARRQRRQAAVSVGDADREGSPDRNQGSNQTGPITSKQPSRGKQNRGTAAPSVGRGSGADGFVTRRIKRR